MNFQQNAVGPPMYTVLKQLSYLQKKSLSRLQLVSFKNHEFIKSLNDQYSFIRIIIFSLLSKIYISDRQTTQRNYQHLKGMIMETEFKQLRESIGVEGVVFQSVILFGLMEMENKLEKYDDVGGTKAQLIEEQLIRIINNIPFFDEGLIRVVSQNLGICSDNEVIMENFEQKFGVGITMVDEQKLQELPDEQIRNRLEETQQTIKVILQKENRKNSNTDSHSYVTYLRMSHRQNTNNSDILQEQASFPSYNSPSTIKYQLLNSSMKFSDNYLPAVLDDSCKMINKYDYVSETPKANIGNMGVSVSNYLLQTIEDSVTDQESPLHGLKMKQNRNEQNLGSIRRKIKEDEDRKNSDVAVFDYQTYYDNIEMHINSQSDRKSKIVRKKAKAAKKEGGFWNFLCCS